MNSNEIEDKSIFFLEAAIRNVSVVMYARRSSRCVLTIDSYESESNEVYVKRFKFEDDVFNNPNARRNAA